jgi:hypothetical protein
MAKRNAISGQWMARPIALIESPAYRALSLSAHRALSRIEIELAHHGGNDNGKLPVTFDDFERYGVRRKSIGLALDELEALGLIKITERGKMAKAAEYRRPNKFLLTTRPELDGVGPNGCGWLRIKTDDDARAAVASAHSGHENSKAARGETPPRARGETPPMRPNRQGRNATTATGRNATTIYISGGGTPNREEGLARPGLATPRAVDPPALDDVLPSNSLTPFAAGPRPAWTKPIVRELFGKERRERLEEIEQADLGAKRVACGREAGALQ